MTSQGEDKKIQLNNPHHRSKIIKLAAVVVVAVVLAFAAKNYLKPDASANKANMQPPAPAVVL